MSRIAVMTFILLLSITSQASAYAVCDRYKFGSQDWWSCQSSQGGSLRKAVDTYVSRLDIASSTSTMRFHQTGRPDSSTSLNVPTS